MFFSKKSLFFLFMIIGFISFSYDKSLAMQEGQRVEIDETLIELSVDFINRVVDLEKQINDFCRINNFSQKERDIFLINFTEKCFASIAIAIKEKTELEIFWNRKTLKISSGSCFFKKDDKKVFSKCSNVDEQLLDAAVAYAKYELIFCLQLKLPLDLSNCFLKFAQSVHEV